MFTRLLKARTSAGREAWYIEIVIGIAPKLFFQENDLINYQQQYCSCLGCQYRAIFTNSFMTPKKTIALTSCQSDGGEFSVYTDVEV
jgi:hypothetical protein